jgi:hypothetical protein
MDKGDQIDGTQAVTLASAAVSDARGFCERQPEACVAGGKVVTALTHKLEAGARTIYEFIAERIRTKLSEKPADADKPTDKAIARQDTDLLSPSRLGRGTLLPADKAPSWHAPVPLSSHREL